MKTKLYLLLVFILMSCNSLLEVDDPNDKIDVSAIFSNNELATSAVLGIYAELRAFNGIASGGEQSYTILGALSADELYYYFPEYNPDLVEFEKNNLSTKNFYIYNFWQSAYRVIYKANSVIDGLNANSGVTESIKKQLAGEAHFLRAFSHFYLLNLFGEIPLITTSDYRLNSGAQRTNVEDVNAQILEDLFLAKDLVDEEYPSNGRTRINKSVVKAFLSRFYLYEEKWAEAEQYATEVLENDSYKLESLDQAFLIESQEAIFQLANPTSQEPTAEGLYMIMVDFPESVALTDTLIGSFEDGDARLIHWVGSVTGDQGQQIYYAKKYKQKSYEQQTEFSIVLRLAEILLIRAEARIHLDKLGEAISDIDQIRDRADVPLISVTNPGIAKDELLLQVEHERQVELFTEGAHRWLDLKRTDRCDEVLGGIKPNWNSNKELYPIPELEFVNNPKLGEQNEGY